MGLVSKRMECMQRLHFQQPVGEQIHGDGATPDTAEHPVVRVIDETVQTAAETPSSNNVSEAYLVQIYPTGPGMGTRYCLGSQPMVIGRGSQCDILADDYSVSRRHAQIQRTDEGYEVVDLDSTNGTLVNKVSAQSHYLQDGDYLQVGKCIYRFLGSDNVESAYHEEIYRLTIIDGLTNVYNKRYLMEALEREQARSGRYQRPLGLILFDIDHFKKINDQRGHLAGDSILRELAGCLKSLFGPEQIFARYGGEEFAVVLPECSLADACAMAEQIRQQVERQPFLAEGQPCPVTVSVGAASTCGEEALTPEEFLARADANLYKAKQLGRNCVVG